MSHDLATLLGGTGTATMVDIAHQVSERSVRTWLQHGRLVRMHPGVIALPDRGEDWMVRARAAVLHAGGQLSHVTALTLWGVIHDRYPRLHVSVLAGRGLRSGPGLAVHRRRELARPYHRQGLPVTGLDCALLDSWSLLNRHRATPGSVAVARSAVINAVRSGRTSASGLSALLMTQPNLTGRSDLSELLDLIAGGCQSELEIWGVQRVLCVPGLPKPVQQHRVVLPSGPVYLDAALPEVKLGIELDGAAYHARSDARERDIIRDAALAAEGWQILRFSYRRLTQDPDGCRRDIVAAYRRRLGSG